MFWFIVKFRSCVILPNSSVSSNLLSFYFQYYLIKCMLPLHFFKEADVPKNPNDECSVTNMGGQNTRNPKPKPEKPETEPE